MSKGTLGQVVKRAISDAAFRRQLQADPEGALKGFDLTSDERAALRSGDAAKLSGFGVDQRMSKAFALGEGASGVTARGNASELSDADGARAAFIDQDSSDGSGLRASLIEQGGGGGRAALTDSDRLSQVNAAFEGGDSAPGGQHSSLDVSGNTRDASVISGDAAGGREGAAYITADEAGRDASPAAAAASDSSATTAFMTSDEMGNASGAYTGDTAKGEDAYESGDSTTTWTGDNEPQA